VKSEERVPHSLCKFNKKLIMTMTAEEYSNTEVSRKLISEKYLDPYKDSIFYLLKCKASRSKGALLEQVYSEYMIKKGVIVHRAESTQHDRIIYENDGSVQFWESRVVLENGKKIEIKGSFGWVITTGKRKGEISGFTFQQLRDQDYDYIVFVYVWPDRIEFYEASKKDLCNVIFETDENGVQIHAQHGGKGKNKDTFWLTGFPSDFPWMKQI